MTPHRVSTRWYRIKQLLFGTSGLLAASLGITTGIGALLRELVVLDERQQVNTKAREKLTTDVVTLATDVAALEKLTAVRLHDDDAKINQFEILRNRVDDVESKTNLLLLEREGVSKRIDELRADLEQQREDTQTAVGFLRSRIDTFADRAQDGEAHPEINAHAPAPPNRR